MLRARVWENSTREANARSRLARQATADLPTAARAGCSPCTRRLRSRAPALPRSPAPPVALEAYFVFREEQVSGQRNKQKRPGRTSRDQAGIDPVTQARTGP